MLDQPLWILMIDGLFGLLQWALIFRFIYGIFLPENSRLFGVRHLNRASEPLVRAYSFLTPDWMINRIRPLYVGFLILIIRFYILPTALDYEVTGLQALSLEAIALNLMDSF